MYTNELRKQAVNEAVKMLENMNKENLKLSIGDTEFLFFQWFNGRNSERPIYASMDNAIGKQLAMSYGNWRSVGNPTHGDFASDDTMCDKHIETIIKMALAKFIKVTHELA